MEGGECRIGEKRKKGENRRNGGGGEYNRAKTDDTLADLRKLPIKKEKKRKKKLHTPLPHFKLDELLVCKHGY